MALKILEEHIFRVKLFFKVYTNTIFCWTKQINLLFKKYLDTNIQDND